jgi:hypothetical protein
MDIPQEVINRWQDVWWYICDMAYYRRNVSSSVHLKKIDYKELLAYMDSAKNFEQITLDYIWKQASARRDANGKYVEPLVVHELKEIYVPRILFTCLGVFTWFHHSFPNCQILFWEDDR